MLSRSQHSGRSSHETRVEFLHRAHSTLLHGRARLRAYEIEYTFDTLLAESAKAPEIGPPDANRLRAHRKPFNHIGPATESAVDNHDHAAVDRRNNLRQRVNG